MDRTWNGEVGGLALLSVVLDGWMDGYDLKWGGAVLVVLHCSHVDLTQFMKTKNLLPPTKNTTNAQMTPNNI